VQPQLVARLAGSSVGGSKELVILVLRHHVEVSGFEYFLDKSLLFAVCSFERGQIKTVKNKNS
jgi:hypothetical protein